MGSYYARFAPEGAKIAETREVAPNVMIDLDAKGELVGIEVLFAAARDPDPGTRVETKAAVDAA